MERHESEGSPCRVKEPTQTHVWISGDKWFVKELGIE